MEIGVISDKLTIKARRMRFVILFAAAIMTSLLVSAKGMAMELSGTLVISTSRGIETLNLQTRVLDLVLKDKWAISLSKIDDHRVLMSKEYGIDELDLGKSTVKKIRGGYSPQYVPEHRKLFFIDRSLSGKYKMGLFTADIDEPTKAEEIEMPPKRTYGFSQDQVVQVSRDEVVFMYDEKAWVYNIPLRTVRELQVENCLQPIAFRSGTSQLLCGDYYKGSKRGREFLVDLNNGAVEEVPGLATHYPIFYIPKFDALITFKTRLVLFPKLGEVVDIWVYSFKDGSETLLRKKTGAIKAVWIK